MMPYDGKLYLFKIVDNYLTFIIKSVVCSCVNYGFLRSVLPACHNVSLSVCIHSHTCIGCNGAGKAISSSSLQFSVYTKQITQELLLQGRYVPLLLTDQIKLIM